MQTKPKLYMVNSSIKMTFTQYDSLELAIVYYAKAFTEYLAQLFTTKPMQKFFFIFHMLVISLLAWLNIFAIRTIDGLLYGQKLVILLCALWLLLCAAIFLLVSTRAIRVFYGGSL